MFKKIIVLLVLITSIVLSQSWNDIKTTNISLANANYAEMFSNSFGNNVILQNTNGSISYYLVNASTGLAGNAITVESSGTSLAQITGESQKVYVIYKNISTNKIVGKFTTNAGANWTSIAELNVNPTSLDAVAYDGKIHITYSLNSIAYYYQYNGSIWTNYKNVSDSEYGFYPRIEMLTSQNKVYVVYNGPNSSAKSREYTVSNNTWAAKQTLHSNVNYSSVAGFGVDANYIYLYYSSVYDNPPYWYYSLYTRKVQKSNYQTVSLSWESYNQTQFVKTTTTADTKIHSAYSWFGVLGDGYQSYPLEPGLIHDSYNNRTRDGENVEVNYNYEQYANVEISSTSNDLFVLWKPATSNVMKYRQYDTAPLAPQNLTVTKSAANHPKLSWVKNNEADLSYYRVEKYESEDLGWVLVGQTSNLYIEDVNESYCTAIPPAQCVAGHLVSYRVKAYDIQLHVSNPSNTVNTYVNGGVPYKIGGEQPVSTPNEYSLDQNYPNPFNPNTKISYSIKEEGLVTLKVYDILGKEIATLANENKSAGNFEIEFNASSLPSGMYIYKLQAGSFTDVKKMILTK